MGGNKHFEELFHNTIYILNYSRSQDPCQDVPLRIGSLALQESILLLHASEHAFVFFLSELPEAESKRILVAIEVSWEIELENAF